MVKPGSKISYKCTLNESSKVFHNDIYKNVSRCKSSYLQMDNMLALSYTKKMGGGTHNKIVSGLAKEIWDYLKVNRIMITVECLPCILNKEADFQSRSVTDSSKWELNSEVFRMICKAQGIPISISLHQGCHISCQWNQVHSAGGEMSSNNHGETWKAIHFLHFVL